MADEKKDEKQPVLWEKEVNEDDKLSEEELEKRNETKFGDEYKVTEATDYSDDDDNGFVSFFKDIGGGIVDTFESLGDLVWNERREPVPNFNFLLRVEGVFDAPCKSVRAFTKELDYEEIREGGRNDYVVLKRKPISHRFTLQVERYVAIDILDPLQLGTELILPLFLGVFKKRTENNSEMARIYFFTGCIVTGKEFGALEGDKSGYYTEVTTIAYREMFYITNPNADKYKKVWKWEDKKKNRSVNTNYDYLNEARATTRKWSFKDPKANRGAYRPVNDKARADIKKWDINDPNNISVTTTSMEGVESTSKVPRKGEAAPKAEVKKWDFTNPKKNRAAVTPPNDTRYAVPKKWSFSKPDKNRGAAKNRKDEKRARVKKWDFRYPNVNKAAKRPENDKDRATVSKWSFEKPDEYRSAVTPPKDKDRATVKKWDIKTPTKNRGSVSPDKDSIRADVKKWDSKNPKKDRAAMSPQNDSQRATVKKWDIKTPGSNKAAVTPKDDNKRASVKKWEFKNPGTNRSAATPPGDTQRATVNKWSFANPTANRRAATSPKDSQKASVTKWSFTNPDANRAAATPPGDSLRAEVKKWDMSRPNENRAAKSAEDVANFMSRR